MAQITIDLAKDILNGAGVTKNEIDQLCNLFLASTPRIVQLEIELAEAKKDQARYQYIRKLNVPQFHKIFMLNLFSNIRFDEAIDAAIASTQEGK